MIILKTFLSISLLLTFNFINKILTYSNSEEKPILVTTQWLDQNIEDENLLILHIGPKDLYEEEHIPHAKLVSMSTLIANSENLSHEFPSVHVMDSVFSLLGLKNNSRIIISYENDMMIPVSARLYLTLDYLGMGRNTSILDGGLSKWKEEGRKMSDDIPEVRGTQFVSKINEKLLVDTNWMNENLRNPDVVIIDSRPEEAYEGREEESKWLRPGHITGAINLPFFKLTDDENPYKFKSTYQLRKLFDDLGIRKDSKIVTYCGTGIWASSVYLIAKHLGHDTYFYDGAYEEWSANKSLSVTSPVSID